MHSVANVNWEKTSKEVQYFFSTRERCPADQLRDFLVKFQQWFRYTPSAVAGTILRHLQLMM
jgi:hypothetical protein